MSAPAKKRHWSSLGSVLRVWLPSGGTLQAGGTVTSPSTRGVTLTSMGLIDTNGNSVSIAGVIGGGGGLTKSGSGTLTLSGLNTYTGVTTVSAGTLSVNSIANVNGGASALGGPTRGGKGAIALGAATLS